MKKLFTAIIILVSINSFSQVPERIVEYKVGLLASLSTGSSNSDKTKISLGSTLVEASFPVNEKISITGNAGYLRYANEGESFAQIPVLVGGKYNINEAFYFGAGLGIGTYIKSSEHTNFLYSPFVGANIKSLSIDIRYFNTTRKNQIKTTALVLSYNL